MMSRFCSRAPKVGRPLKFTAGARTVVARRSVMCGQVARGFLPTSAIVCTRHRLPATRTRQFSSKLDMNLNEHQEQLLKFYPDPNKPRKPMTPFAMFYYATLECPPHMISMHTRLQKRERALDEWNYTPMKTKRGWFKLQMDEQRRFGTRFREYVANSGWLLWLVEAQKLADSRPISTALAEFKEQAKERDEGSVKGEHDFDTWAEKEFGHLSPSERHKYLRSSVWRLYVWEEGLGKIYDAQDVVEWQRIKDISKHLRAGGKFIYFSHYGEVAETDVNTRSDMDFA